MAEQYEKACEEGNARLAVELSREIRWERYRLLTLADVGFFKSYEHPATQRERSSNSLRRAMYG